MRLVWIFWITVLIALSGCASTDYFAEMRSCQVLAQEQKVLVQSCETSEAIGVTDEMCEAIVVPDCQEKVDAYDKAEERKIQREKARKERTYCSDRGMVRQCTHRGISKGPGDCVCISGDDLRQIFERVGGRW